jgi:hypothetical protein
MVWPDAGLGHFHTSHLSHTSASHVHAAVGQARWLGSLKERHRPCLQPASILRAGGLILLLLGTAGRSLTLDELECRVQGAGMWSLVVTGGSVGWGSFPEAVWLLLLLLLHHEINRQDQSGYVPLCCATHGGHVPGSNVDWAVLERHGQFLVMDKLGNTVCTYRGW